jgi:hypothetical protein
MSSKKMTQCPATLLKRLPPEWQAGLRQERREAVQAAKVFARICAEGDADRLYNAHLLLNERSSDALRLAMSRVAKLPKVSREIQEAFLNIWIESKMLPLRVGSRRVLANALRVLMPANYTGPPLTLYRGTSTHERRRRNYGFCWTTDAAIAANFAAHWQQPDISIESVVLQTLAPPKAILLIRKPEDYYDEGEVVVDPFRLGKVFPST